MNDDERRSVGSPAIYAVGDTDLREMLGVLLDTRKLSCRTFTGTKVMLAEFTSASVRPALLITGCLDDEGTGLKLIRACKRIEPALKVLLWSGYEEKALASMLVKIPVVPDARLPKGKEVCLEKLLETIERLLKHTSFARLAGA